MAAYACPGIREKVLTCAAVCTASDARWRRSWGVISAKLNCPERVGGRWRPQPGRTCTGTTTNACAPSAGLHRQPN